MFSWGSSFLLIGSSGLFSPKENLECISNAPILDSMCGYLYLSALS